MKVTLSQGQYLDVLGAHCPWCQSDDLRGGDLQAEGPEIVLHVECNTCHQRWDDIYRLAGFKTLERE